MSTRAERRLRTAEADLNKEMSKLVVTRLGVDIMPHCLKCAHNRRLPYDEEWEEWVCVAKGRKQRIKMRHDGAQILEVPYQAIDINHQCEYLPTMLLAC